MGDGSEGGQMNTPQTDEELIEAFDEMFLSDKTFKDIHGKSKSGRYNEEEIK